MNVKLVSNSANTHCSAQWINNEWKRALKSEFSTDSTHSPTTRHFLWQHNKYATSIMKCVPCRILTATWGEQFLGLGLRTGCFENLSDGMITHNGDVVNRKACWKCILNKLNHQQSVPVASPHCAADIKALSRVPQLLQALMRNEEQLQQVWRPPYLNKSDNDYRRNSQDVLRLGAGGSVLTTASFIVGGFPEVFFSEGSGEAPCRAALLWVLPQFHLIVCFTLIARWSEPAALSNKLCFLCVFSVLFSFVYVYKRTD